MFKQYSKFIYYASLFEKYLGKKLYFAFILSLTAGLSESFGITMLFPLFSSLENGGIDVSSQQKIGTSLISINKIVSFAANNNYGFGQPILNIYKPQGNFFTTQCFINTTKDQYVGQVTACWDNNRGDLVFNGCFKTPCSDSANRFQKRIGY